MGLRGPKPKPTNLQLFEGNPGHRKINYNEPKPKQIEDVEPPKELSEAGKAVWKTLSKELCRLGLLTEIDVWPFYRYVTYLMEFVEAEKFLQPGMLVKPHKDAKGGVSYYTYNPFLPIRNEASRQMARLEQMFGITPSARARMISMAEGRRPVEDDDPYAA